MKHLKDEFDKLTIKEIIVYSLAIVCMVSAIVAVFLGMFIAPKGEVHASILTYFGISMAFCSALLGISAHYASELEKFKASILASLTTPGATAETLLTK